MNVDELSERATRVLRSGPPLRLAILFGSFARGRAHAGSDVDIAILPVDPDLPLDRELELAAQLARALAREVDVVRIDHATTAVRWEIARDGLALIAEPAVELVRFRASSASEHADLQPALDHAAELFRRRIARSGP